MTLKKTIVLDLALVTIVAIAFFLLQRDSQRSQASESSQRTNYDAVNYSVAGFADLVYPVVPPARYVPTSTLTREQLIAIKSNIELPTNAFGFRQHSFDQLTDNIESDFLFADVSGDNEPDLLFSGSIYAEESSTLIWTKQDSTYKFTALLWGKPVLLIQDSTNMPCSIVTVTGYCCAGTVGNYTLFAPTYGDGVLIYSDRETYRKFLDLVIPTRRMEPRSFTVIALDTKLRSSPIIVDSLNTLESEVMGMQVFGNILAKLDKGSVGTMLAQQQDSLGILWYFVAMAPGTSPSYNRFYGDPQDCITGWIRANGVTLMM